MGKRRTIHRPRVRGVHKHSKYDCTAQDVEARP